MPVQKLNPVDIEAAIHSLWTGWKSKPQQGAMSYALAKRMGVPLDNLVPGEPVCFRTDRDGVRHYYTWIDPDEAL